MPPGTKPSLTGNGSKPYKSAAGGNRFRFQASRPLIDVNKNQPHSQTSPAFDPSLLTPSKNPPQVTCSRSPSSSHDSNSNANPSWHDSDDPFKNVVLNDIGKFCYFDKFLTLFSGCRWAVTRWRWAYCWAGLEKVYWKESSTCGRQLVSLFETFFWSHTPLYLIVDGQSLDEDEQVSGQAVNISKRKPRSMDNSKLKHLTLVINI